MTVPGAECLCLAVIRVLLTASATVSHSKIEVSHSSHFWFAIESQSAIYYVVIVGVLCGPQEE